METTIQKPKQKAICRACSGHGVLAVNEVDDEVIQCPRCSGTGLSGKFVSCVCVGLADEADRDLPICEDYEKSGFHVGCKECGHDKGCHK